MKKFLSLLVVMSFLFSLSACSSNDGTFKIAILQQMTHDALDLSREGFMDALKDNGFIEGENLTLDYENPQSDPSSLAMMADSLVSDDNDLILAIGTNPALALKKANYDTPIIATAITDFKEAGIVENIEAPEGYITGVSDNCPSDDQIQLIKELVPDVKTIGIIYTSSEPNSEIQATQMAESAKEEGIETIIKTVSDKTVINDTLEAFKGEIDLLYVPTDNNIASAMGSVAIFAKENKLPVVCGESNAAKSGGLASLGVDYYTIGYQSGEMAVSILKGEKTINELPIETQKEFSVYYNLNTADEIGFEIPQSIIAKGIDISE